jgi:N-acetylglucosamine kinase-like BadF-type ATPase
MARINRSCRGYGGPSNYKDNGLRTFLSAIRTAAQGALDALIDSIPVVLPTVESILTATSPEEQPPPLLYSAWIGASGVDTTQDVVTLLPLLSRLLGVPLISHRLMVQNDSHLLSSPLLTASDSTREAVVAIAGTGSVVVSFRKQRPSHQDASESIVHLARGSRIS